MFADYFCGSLGISHQYPQILSCVSTDASRAPQTKVSLAQEKKQGHT